MFTSQRNSGKARLPVVAVLCLFSTMGQSAIVTDQTTSAPALTNSSLTTHLNNTSLDYSLDMKLQRPCGSDYANWCANDGQCVYQKDSHSPSCICTFPYSGDRCLLFTDLSRLPLESEQLIGVIFGIIMMLVALAIIIYCCARYRCVKLAPLKKSAPGSIV